MCAASNPLDVALARQLLQEPLVLNYAWMRRMLKWKHDPRTIWTFNGYIALSRFGAGLLTLTDIVHSHPIRHLTQKGGSHATGDERAKVRTAEEPL
jgi:hypothetical protein